MPSEYKPATVTSGDVRARISGDLVSVSGSIAATVSGEPVTISGQVVRVSGMTETVAGINSDNIDPATATGRSARSFLYGYDGSTDEWNRAQVSEPATVNPESILSVGLRGHDDGPTLARRLEVIASGEPILMVGHASGTRLISVSSQLIDSGGMLYTGAAVSFPLGKFSRFALFVTATRSGASGQTVEAQIQFSDDFGDTWYDLVDAPFGALLYEGEQVGAVGTLRDVQTGRVAGGDMRIMVRTSGSTLDSSNNFTVSAFTMLLN